MAGQYKRFVSVVLVTLIALQSYGCDYASADEAISEAAFEYADGRPTETLSFTNEDDVMDEQIEEFICAYYRPTQVELTDDEYEERMRELGDSDFDIDDPDTWPTMTPDEEEFSSDVASMDDLSRVLHYAYDNTLTSISFTFTDGFYVDLADCINDVYTDLQRIDPIDVCCVEHWEWSYSGNRYSLIIDYYYDVDELISMKNATPDLVQSAVDQIQPEGKTDYEIVYAVNEYLCDNVDFPDSEPYASVTHTAYGALNNGCAVCEGYACAAVLILRGCGVESDIEVGECAGGGHAWNLVKVDGAWYQLDVCWDDGGRRDMYFLVDDDYMRQNRIWVTENYPVCPDCYDA